MRETLTHYVPLELELRDDGAAGGDGRTLVGLAVPFGVPLEVRDWDDYTEVFVRGAFAKTIRDRAKPVPLLLHHDHRRNGVGKATKLTETDRGLEAEFHLTPGVQSSDEALALVVDDVLTGLSIGFEPVLDELTRASGRTPPADRDLITRTEVALREVSLCNFPAFAAAGVEGTRSSSSSRTTGGAGRSLANLAAERTQLRQAGSDALDRWGRARLVLPRR
jgi:hypothetical protein